MSDDIPENEDLPQNLTAEMVDREERKAQKAKLREEERSKKSKLYDEDVEAAFKTSKLAKAQAAKRKNAYRFGGVLLALAFVVWAYYYLFATYSASMAYGVCKTFLELNVQFPQDLRVSTVEEFSGYTRIWYTQLDAFGEYRMEQIQCYFNADYSSLEKITVNRRELDPQKVEDFNKILPVVLASPVDLKLPPRLPDSLQDLQIDTDSFRFQLRLRSK